VANGTTKMLHWLKLGGDVEIDCGGMCVCVVKEDEVLNWILVMMTSI